MKKAVLRQIKTGRATVPDGRITVVYHQIASLKPSPDNPRVHPENQIQRLSRSISEFGFTVPVFVDSHLQVICGHGRLLAAQKLGWTEVPTIALEHLTAAQSKAYRICDNRLSDLSSWSEKTLGEQLKELAALDLSFDIEVVGFENAELDLLIQNLDAPRTSDIDPADQIPSDSGPPVTKPGDLWLLGPHRVLSGNALEQASYATLMNGKKAVMVFTDPPYGVKISGHVSGLGACQTQRIYYGF